MIRCVSPNPAWDVTYEVDRLLPGQTHRVRVLPRRAGGKGANVARVLSQLKEPCELVVPLGADDALGFVSELEAVDVAVTSTRPAGAVRTSVTVRDGDRATVFNEPGSPLTATQWQDFLTAAAADGASASCRVFSGSLPPGAPADGYRQLLEATRAPGSVAVLDAGGQALGAALNAHPDLVKPNRQEVEQWLGRTLDEERDVVAAAHELRRCGARTVLVTLGRAGAVLVTEDLTLRGRSTTVVDGNPTGAGDALTAGIAAGLSRGRPWADVLAEGMALAAASVAEPQAGSTDLDRARSLRASIHIEEVSWP